uniref:Uncharacterized protein n=1 Tax=Vannella robusta TaxID=1487602 RepID=A0A7S4IS08_9EUKA|mmetsp:Transcript_7682/g.9524  ORF Transcript_7682/g.9524 Transcript_7682/m.9524 type:complete len:138 (+) Transcript_7682:238-651(+)
MNLEYQNYRQVLDANAVLHLHLPQLHTSMNFSLQYWKLKLFGMFYKHLHILPSTAGMMHLPFTYNASMISSTFIGDCSKFQVSEICTAVTKGGIGESGWNSFHVKLAADSLISLSNTYENFSGYLEVQTSIDFSVPE